MELHDADGPMTERLTLPLMKVRADVMGVYYHAGPHLEAKVLHKGRPTHAVWYADFFTDDPAIEVDVPTIPFLDKGTFQLGDTPLFRTLWTEMKGVRSQ